LRFQEGALNCPGGILRNGIGPQSCLQVRAVGTIHSDKGRIFLCTLHIFDKLSWSGACVGGDVLQQLGDHISNCFARARDAEARAEAAADSQIREDNLALARQWRDVAERYQLIESLERFLLDVDASKVPLAQLDAEPFLKDLQRECPKCSAVMRLSRVEPAEPDHDRRWFECEQCSYEENVIIKFR